MPPLRMRPHLFACVRVPLPCVVVWVVAGKQGAQRIDYSGGQPEKDWARFEPVGWEGGNRTTRIPGCRSVLRWYSPVIRPIWSAPLPSSFSFSFFFMVNTGMLVALGYDPALIPDRIQVTAGSGVEFAPRVLLDRIMVLGRVSAGFPVLGHTLPSSAGIDGLLGLDFFRGFSLTIDFRTGQFALA